MRSTVLRRLRILGLLIAAALILALVTFRVVPVAHSDYEYDLEVRGVLVDAASGEPTPSAFTLACLASAEHVDDVYVADWRMRIRGLYDVIAGKDAEIPYGSFPLTGANAAVTDYAGRFRTWITVKWSYNTGQSGCDYDRGENLKDGTRVRALRIERRGRTPVVVDAPTGTWTKHGKESAWWATHDMGVIRVPSEP